MSLYVHLHVVIPANENYTLALYAKDHLRYYNRDDCIEARWFLNELSNRRGTNPGPKGGLSLWGIIGNATHPEVFVGVLKPFWERVLRGNLTTATIS